MQLELGLPYKFWGEALMSAAYLQNHHLIQIINKKPYELWNFCKPNLSHIKEFGCLLTSTGIKEAS